MNLPDMTIMGMNAKTWMISFSVAAGAFIILLLIRKFIGKKMAEIAGEINLETGKLLEGIIVRTGTYFLIAVSLYAGSMVLALPPGIASKFGIIVFLIFLLQVSQWGGWLIAWFVNKTIKKRKEEGTEDATVFGLVKFFLRGALWAILLLLALDNLGIDITALVAGLGIGGIAIALAAQKILGDLFSALSIVLDKPFMVGDFIELGDCSGTVEQIGLKNTRLRSAYGEQIIIPNSDLLQGRIRNYRDRSERRALFTIQITCQTPLEKLKKIPQWLKEIVEDQEHARFDRAHFKEYGDYSLNFEIVYYVVKPDFSLFIKIQERVNLAIFEKFQNENVYFAYPTQTILTQKGMNSS